MTGKRAGNVATRARRGLFPANGSVRHALALAAIVLLVLAGISWAIGLDLQPADDDGDQPVSPAAIAAILLLLAALAGAGLLLRARHARRVAERGEGAVTIADDAARPSVWTAPAAPAARGRISGYEGPQRSLLVIDDDPAQTIVLLSFLRPLGFAVRAAASGPEGIALAGRHPADLVLLDIQMPDMNGWQVAERLRADHGETLRIVMVSANSHEFHAGGEGRSHNAFATKPVDLDKLLLLIGIQLGLRWTVTEKG